MTDDTRPRIVIVSGGTGDPSSTRMLADRIAGRVRDLASADGLDPTLRIIELRPLAADVAAAQVAGFPAGGLADAIGELARADALVVVTPVYKAGVSGLVKSFFDAVDQDVLLAVPTALAATAGTARHALVADEGMRSLFAYFRALTVPTSVFAASEDWGTPALRDRIDRAARELLVLVRAGVKDALRAGDGRYQRVFGGASEGGDLVDFDSDLMRLAAGGAPSAASTRPRTIADLRPR